MGHNVSVALNEYDYFIDVSLDSDDDNDTERVPCHQRKIGDVYEAVSLKNACQRLTRHRHLNSKAWDTVLVHDDLSSFHPTQVSERLPDEVALQKRDAYLRRLGVSRKTSPTFVKRRSRSCKPQGVQNSKTSERSSGFCNATTISGKSSGTGFMPGLSGELPVKDGKAAESLESMMSHSISMASLSTLSPCGSMVSMTTMSRSASAVSFNSHIFDGFSEPASPTVHSMNLEHELQGSPPRTPLSTPRMEPASTPGMEPASTPRMEPASPTTLRKEFCSGLADSFTSTCADSSDESLRTLSKATTTCMDLVEGSETPDAKASANKHRMKFLQRLSYERVWVPRVQRALSHQTILIFDWDDTLLCTSFLYLRKPGSLSSGPKCVLKEMEKVVTTLLTLALRLGNTFIITNAKNGWVEQSAEEHLPGLLPVLQRIRVVSARSRYEAEFPDEVSKWKAETFLEVQRQFDSQVITNLVSVGDSFFERKAAQAVGREYDNTVIKTIKFREFPTPEELVKQQKLVCKEFEQIVGSPHNLRMKMKPQEKKKLLPDP